MGGYDAEGDALHPSDRSDLSDHLSECRENSFTQAFDPWAFYGLGESGGIC
jgi:hypothetical protein